MHPSEPLDKKLIYKQYLSRESQTFHESSDSEQHFYTAVASGNLPLVRELLANHSLSQKEALGILSDSPLQNLKYHFAISTALTARHCIENGMLREEAFHLSDLYIKTADSLTNGADIDTLLCEMFFDYTKKMQGSSLVPRSKEVSQCISYIYEHLHEPITATELADYVGFDRSYLSRLFKEQTGQSPHAYITQKKLETARNMLLYSDYDIAMISNIFSFSSQSHFTALFRKKYGKTPKQYRDASHKNVYPSA